MCRKADKILLAVSGGMDSMVMCHLFIRSGFDNLSIAHCNFRLRGDDSELDEAFVRSYAAEHGIKFFCRQFDTRSYASTHSMSIQMAARELRYTWFSELLKEHTLDLIATAHHADDNIETFFINLLRGSGIAGLHGIKARNEHLIRPLLFAERAHIEAYREKQQVSYREDRSNASQDYLRNKIRLKFLPVLEEIEPAYRNALRNTMDNLSATDRLYRKMLVQFRKVFVSKDEKERIYLPIDRLLLQQPMNILLYELLNPYDFRADQIENIIAALDGISGKLFFSETHQLLIDREFIIISPVNSSAREEFLINEDDREINKPIKLKILHHEVDKDFKIPKDKLMACLDFDQLVFPLEITRWKEGDSFKPLGMTGSKKLSDFFIDEKLSRIQKEETFILRSAGKIVWIIGHRIDEHYKTTPLTKKALIIQLIR